MYLYLLLVLVLALSQSDVNLATAVVAQREAATIPPHRRLATESCKGCVNQGADLSYFFSLVVLPMR
jgi:hypothetical protein